MQAVILAAGRSTRTFPLTLTRPKPLLMLANKTLLEHKLDALHGLVDEAIIVVGYKQEMIRQAIGHEYRGMRIHYVEQEEQKGTGHAFLLVKNRIKGRFIALYGDDWYSVQDIKACIGHEYAVLVSEVEHPEHFGVVQHEHLLLKDIIEKPSNPPSNLINTGLYMLDERIFPHLEQIEVSERGDIEFPPALVALATSKKVHCILAQEYFSIGYPWDLLRADRAIRDGKNAIQKTATVRGHVENCSIGEHCIINGTAKHSIIMGNTVIEEGASVEHSIIGCDVMFSGAIKAGKTTSIVNGKPIDAGFFGAAVGDGVHASNALIMPGCKVWPNKKITGTIKEDAH